MPQALDEELTPVELSRYCSVLVPVECSPFSEHALPLALSIANWAGATLQVVHVHAPVASEHSSSELAYDLDSSVIQEEYGYLNGLAKRLACFSSTRVTTSLMTGPVAETLGEVARGSDLIVMATHGRGPLSRFWLGSVADKLVRKSPVPIVLVRPQEEGIDLADKPVLHHILIPLDGSELAEQVLEPALELGRLMEGDCTLLRAIEPVIVPDAHLGGNALTGLDASVRRQLEAQAQTYLDRVAERLRRESIPVRTRVVFNRSAAVAILEEARAHAIDLIALETHGRGGMARLLLGSVADKVLRGASIPVLMHRATETP